MVEYKPIPGFPGYRVGDDGSVWSCRNRQGQVTESWHLLKPMPTHDGYLRVTLSVDGKTKRFRVNHLVLVVFVGPPQPGMQAAHDNNIRSDNRLSNLSWKTPGQNNDDKKRHGTDQIGERHPNHKVTENDVLEIRQRIASGESQKSIASDFDLTRANVGTIAKRKTWKHV